MREHGRLCHAGRGLHPLVDGHVGAAAQRHGLLSALDWAGRRSAVDRHRAERRACRRHGGSVDACIRGLGLGRPADHDRVRATDDRSAADRDRAVAPGATGPAERSADDDEYVYAAAGPVVATPPAAEFAVVPAVSVAHGDWAGLATWARPAAPRLPAGTPRCSPGTRRESPLSPSQSRTERRRALRRARQCRENVQRTSGLPGPVRVQPHADPTQLSFRFTV